jgi:membrane-bound serine protease (ClpP class)
MRISLVLVLGVVPGWTAETNLPAPVSTSGAKTVCVLPIREELSPKLARRVEDNVREAIKQKADLLVLDLETSGGRLDSYRAMVASLGRFRGPTVAYVNGSALGGGAGLALAAQRIYMAPGSLIGAGAPVVVSPLGQPGSPAANSQQRQVVSIFRATVCATALSNGHSPAVLGAMIDPDLGLVVTNMAGGVPQPVTLAKVGELLSLTAADAEREFGQPPRKLLSSGTVGSLDELLSQLGYGNAVRLPIRGSSTLRSVLQIAGAGLLFLAILVLASRSFCRPEPSQ